MVKNDLKYARIFSTSDASVFTYQHDDSGSGDASDLYVYGAPVNPPNTPDFTFLGDICENGARPFKRERFVAAVNNRYLTQLGNRGEPTNPFRFIGNDSGLGFNSNVSWWSRTTPFHTFVTCSNARGAYCDTVDGVEFGRFANYDIVPEDRSGHYLDRKTCVSELKVLTNRRRVLKVLTQQSQAVAM